MEATKKLDFGQTIKGAIQIGTKNAFTVLGTTILYVLTVWIPYLNIGTTIAFFTVLPVKLGKGESFSPTEIFDAKYRENMTNFFIVLGLFNAAIGFAMMLMFFPGLVVMYAWMLAAPLVINKGMSPIEALNASYKATYGSKWTIFFSYLVLGIIIFVVYLIFAGIAWVFGQIAVWLGAIFGFLFGVAIAIISAAAYVGMFGQIYKSLILDKPAIEQEG